MLRSAATDGTLAYMGFLCLLFTYKFAVGRRQSRKLRERISHYSAKP